MSTIVCQNLISCYETETTTTLKLTVAPPSPTTVDLFEISSSADHAPSHEISIPKESSHTHHINKKSSFSISSLSAESLELCTENLGSESGSDIISGDSNIFSSSNSFEKSSPHSNFYHEKSKRSRKSQENPKIENFPPPLTTMSGSTSLQMRRRREGGRLIIEAVAAPFRNSYLQAERSGGRLMLCFSTRDERQREDDECGGEIEEISAGEESEKEETEMEKFHSVSRCHRNEELCSNWKPALWVASS